MPGDGFLETASFEGGDHGFHIPRQDVAHHGNDTTPTHAHDRQGQAIVAAENRQAGSQSDLRNLVKRATCLFDANNVRNFREPGDSFGQNVGTGTAGDVVKDDRDVHSFGNGSEMAVVTFLGGFIVIRADH
jgi:hypothetical protein